MDLRPTPKISCRSLEQDARLFAPRIMDVTVYEITVDAQKPLFLQDSSKIWHFCSAQQLIGQYARRIFDKSIDRLIDQIRKESKTDGN